MKITRTIAILSLGVSVSGCIPLIVGGMATAGYMSTQERGIKAAFTDTKLATHIKDRLVSKRYEYLTEVTVDVLKGDVLLTGVVKDDAAASEIEQIVRGVPGTKNVYNELFSDGSYSSKQYSKDAWIATQVRARIFGAKDLNAADFQISVVNNHVYLFGLVTNGSEKERATHLARITQGVAKVIDYTRLKENTVSKTGQMPNHVAPEILQETP